jgi:hypothetical protein
VTEFLLTGAGKFVQIFRFFVQKIKKCPDVFGRTSGYFSVIMMTFARGSAINLFLKAGAAGCG